MQIKVVVLGDVTPFVRLIEQQAASPVAPALPNEMFDRWVDSSDSILLNAIPVRWNGDTRTISADRDRPAPGGTF